MSEEVLLATLKKRILLGLDFVLPKNPRLRRKTAEMVARACAQTKEEIEFSRADVAAASPEVRPFLEADL